MMSDYSIRSERVPAGLGGGSIRTNDYLVFPDGSEEFFTPSRALREMNYLQTRLAEAEGFLREYLGLWIDKDYQKNPHGLAARIERWLEATP